MQVVVVVLAATNFLQANPFTISPAACSVDLYMQNTLFQLLFWRASAAWQPVRVTQSLHSFSSVHV
jgi:hypothetical protein